MTQPTVTFKNSTMDQVCESLSPLGVLSRLVRATKTGQGRQKAFWATF